MTFATDAEKNQIEARPRAVGKGKIIAQRIFIRLGRGAGTALGFDAVNVFLWNRDVREQRLVSRSIIAVGMIGRHGALIAPEKMRRVPRHPRAKSLARKHSIER